MNSSVNKYGLRRSDLTDPQMREIRQSAGFGCVGCGCAIGDYEHVDPPFSEAVVHDPTRMTFLCTGCHSKVTRGRLSKETVKEWMKAPAALRDGFSFDRFDVGKTRPTIVLGSVTAVRPKVLLQYNGRPFFYVDEPEEPGGPFRLNATMTNEAGDVIFSIKDNVWQARTSNWDVVSKGPRTIIRNGPGQIALVVRTDPPDLLVVERMHMTINGTTFKSDGRSFEIQHRGRVLRGSTCRIEDCDVAISFNDGALVIGQGGGSIFLTNLVMGPLSGATDMGDKRQGHTYGGQKSAGNFASEPNVTGALWRKVQQIRNARR